MSENQKKCLILVDEVYVKVALQCHGGNLFVLAKDYFTNVFYIVDAIEQMLK